MITLHRLKETHRVDRVVILGVDICEGMILCRYGSAYGVMAKAAADVIHCAFKALHMLSFRRILKQGKLHRR